MISRDQIEKRLADLQRQERDAFGNYQAVIGAIQDCEFFLALCKEPEGETPPAPPPE